MSKYVRKLQFLLFISVICGVLFGAVQPAAAAFNANNLMSDAVFDNVGSMNSAQIDAFLNQFPSSCISTNNGFLAIDPNGYSPSTSYQYGGFVSAGTVIAHAAQAYDVNPQVLLTTLQKEQALVTGGSGCSTLRYTAAVGYGCPDSGTTHSYSNVNLYALHGTIVTSVSGTCVNSASKAGFSQQVIRAAWLLKFGQQRSRGNIGWAIVRGNWDNSDDPQSCYGGPMTQGTYRVCPSGSAVYYDGYRTIDGQAVHMDTGATATLYWYTPHLHGNQNFVDLFTSWFGSPFLVYTWSTVAQKAYADSSKREQVNLGQLGPGQRYYLTIVVRNTGNVTWQRNGSTPVHLGTASPIDHTSAFCDPTWLACNRPALLHEYSVAPGQYGSFEFWITTPSTPAYLNEIFAPVMEGVTWLGNSTVSFPMIINPATYTWNVLTKYAYTDSSKQTRVDPAHLQPGRRYYVGFSFKNTGDMTWERTGSKPVALGTANTLDRPSSFCDTTWIGGAPNCNRPVPLHEYTVRPGQTGSFEFWIKAPSTGTYSESFLPLVEGVTWMSSPPITFGLNVDPLSWKMGTQRIYTDSTKQRTANLGQLAPGERYYFTVEAKNTGTVTWTKNGSVPVALGTAKARDSASALCDSTWSACNRAAQLHEWSVAPGQTGSFEFWIKASDSSGYFASSFTPLVEGLTWMGEDTVNIWSHVNAASYSWQIIQQEAFTSSSKQTVQNMGNLAAGQRYYVRAVVKNTGNTTWKQGGSHPMSLGTATPRDRSSVFCDNGTWLGCNRPALLHEYSVAPGQYGSFEFWIKAPAAGSYNERYAPIAEGLAWLDDHTMSFPANVH